MASETTQVALSANRTQILMACQKVTSELIKFPGVLDIMLELCTSGTLHDAWKGDTPGFDDLEDGEAIDIVARGKRHTNSCISIIDDGWRKMFQDLLSPQNWEK